MRVSRSRLAAAVVVVLALVICGPASASAVPPSDAHWYSHWSFTGAADGFWELDQDLTVTRRADHTFWAQLWNWAGSDDGAYLGLQTDGSRFDGTVGNMALFSAWNAVAARGPSCGSFGGEGTGLSCHLAYPFRTGTTYRLHLRRLALVATGRWWGAWIENTGTGAKTLIGRLEVQRDEQLATNVQNFAEYFGAPTWCSAVPKSRAVWTSPLADLKTDGRYLHSSTYYAQDGDEGGCTGGAAVPDGDPATGVTVTLGGKQNLHHP